MRSWLAAFTTRGMSFLAAGSAAALAGLFLGERDLVSVGHPAAGAAAVLRAGRRPGALPPQLRPQYLARRASPPGRPRRRRLRLENVSRLPTGLLLAEDAVPYALGTRPRYVLNGIERGGSRELSYPLRSDLRGRFVVGPLEIRIADAFGLVEFGRSFSASTTFVVTPKVVPLPRAVVTGSWLGDGDGRARAMAAAGEDDVVPRAYRDGDELRRVHWRSTARYGELMVRREEQQWRNRVLLLLDTRRGAHAGSGAASSFEFAVSAAASIGVHLAHEGLGGQLVTDTGAVGAAGAFEDVLLNSLAVIKPSRGQDLGPGVAALRSTSGLLVAVIGRLSPGAARQLAASRRDTGPAIALLLAVSTWAGPGQDRRAQPARPRAPASGRTGRSAQRPMRRPRSSGRRAGGLPASTRARSSRSPGSSSACCRPSRPARRRWAHSSSRARGERGEPRYEPQAHPDRGRGRDPGVGVAVPAVPERRMVLGRDRRGHRRGHRRDGHQAADPGGGRGDLGARADRGGPAAGQPELGAAVRLA